MTEPEIAHTPEPPEPRPTMTRPEAIIRNCAEAILLLMEFVRAQIDKPMTLQSENFEIVIRKRPGLFRRRPQIDKPGAIPGQWAT